MALNSLSALLEDELKDLFSAENQLLKALPNMAKKAEDLTLKTAFSMHLAETEGHVARLETIAKSLGIKLGGKKCKAMEGLIEEGKEILGEDGKSPVIDAALIGAAQRVEHYEMAAYGTVRAMADTLGMASAVQLLQTTLNEEAAADKKLTSIAQSTVLGAAKAMDVKEEPQDAEADNVEGDDATTEA